jgi:hypothetical protein
LSIQGNAGRISRGAFLGLGGMSASALMLNGQNGPLGVLATRTAEGHAVTYAIYGPFEKRAGANNQDFGNGSSTSDSSA